MMKRVISRQSKTFLDLCIPTNVSLKYLQQKWTELQKEINSSQSQLRNFNIPLSE